MLAKGWYIANLANVLDVLETGSRPQGGVSSESGEVPSIGGENIGAEGRMIYGGVRRIPQPFFDAMPRGHLKTSDVLINKDGAQTGKVGVYQGEFPAAAINEHVFLMRGKPSILDQGYLFHYLIWGPTQKQIARTITGSAQPGINTRFADILQIVLPSLPEQRRIAEILDTHDAAIVETETMISKLKQMKIGLMHDLLTRGLDERGTLRDPDAHPEQFKDSSLGRIPQEWEVRDLMLYVNG